MENASNLDLMEHFHVRHAQGVHNIALEEKGEKPESEKLFDAHLSPKGLQQVSERRNQILESGLLNTVELVITSPLCRYYHLNLDFRLKNW
jgi:broad specificity phosphatase PhoE